MYNTNDVHGQTSMYSGSDRSTVDKFSLQMSYAPSILKNINWLDDNGSTAETVREITSCLSSCAPIIMALILSCVIILWVVALIADGPNEMHNCVILWPILAGVLFIAVLFIFLRCAEFCLKRGRHRKKPKTVGEPLGMRDSLRMRRLSSTIPEDGYPNYRSDNWHIWIAMSYLLLVFALFCVMIGSVVQFYSLDSACYHHLQETVSQLLLGYEVLAYTSVVILCMLGCLLVCCCLAIVITCCTQDSNIIETS